VNSHESRCGCAPEHPCERTGRSAAWPGRFEAHRTSSSKGVGLLRHTDLLDRLQDGLASPHLNLDLSKLRCNLLAPVPSFRVALVASLGLLHPQILSLEAVLLKGGRSRWRSAYVLNWGRQKCRCWWLAAGARLLVFRAAAAKGVEKCLPTRLLRRSKLAVVGGCVFF